MVLCSSLVAAFTLVAGGCFLERAGGAPASSYDGGVDASRVDAGRVDASRVDVGAGDAGAEEGGVDGGGTEDAGPACVEAERRCEANRIEVCGSGAWTVVMDCVDGTCRDEGGVLVCARCTSGEERCGPGGDHERCDAGAWVTSESCAALCLDDASGVRCAQCVDGTTRACSDGACAGTQTCGGETWGACSARSAPETCDGADQDCDGRIDEGASGGVCDCTRAVSGGHAYYTCTDTISWDEARRSCRANGYDLAVFETRPENEALRASVAAGSGTYYWIGLSDAATEGSWVWLDGSAPSYGRWYPGGGGTPAQPNGGGPDDCAFMDAAGYWYDWSCGIGDGYVCEAGP